MSAKPKNKTPQTRGKQPDLIVAKIVSEFKDRTRAEIRKWRQALEMAGDVNTPRLYALQDLYDNLKDDGHFISQIELRKAATLCAPFHIQDRRTGEIDEEKTKLFMTEWFYNFMEDALEAPPYEGYAHIQTRMSLSLSVADRAYHKPHLPLHRLPHDKAYGHSPSPDKHPFPVATCHENRLSI